ncbi:hypothetical protein COO60DRAFT_773391 [Scenedesmus sp. NREL 46B-D3]|nr:hypothetical protein COO60DRAFT_773391 [Scenedesmus sp. NREL 46B-D3]
MPKKQVANLLYRFFDWWIDGKPGDPVQGGSANRELGRSAAMKVHSALQKLLDGCCCRVSADSYALKDINPYKGLYKKYCSKKRDKHLVAAAAASDVGLARAAHLHQSFGRETYLLGCRRLLASADHGNAMLLSMFTSQVSMVARGDDLRSRRLLDLSTRMMACVGRYSRALAQQLTVQTVHVRWLANAVCYCCCCCCCCCCAAIVVTTALLLAGKQLCVTIPCHIPLQHLAAGSSQGQMVLPLPSPPPVSAIISCIAHCAANRALYGRRHHCDAATRHRQDAGDAPCLQGYSAQQAA